MVAVTFDCRIVILTVALAHLGAAPARADVTTAATRGSVGEIPNHMIAPNGATIDVMDNDFLGTTDKYMTGSMKAGWTHNFAATEGKGYVSSVELMATWRALTPTESGEVGGRPLGRLVGRFADWMEGELAYARTYPVVSGHSLKGQLSLGAGHVGNKGMRRLHVKVHSLIGMQTGGLEYTDQPVGQTAKYDALVGDALHVGATEILVAVGNAKDLATTDSYLQGNLTTPLGRRVSLGLEARVIRQFGSQIYEGLSTWRREASFGLRVYDYYQPSFKYVSQYLNADDRGQFYAELLRFNVPF